MNTWPVLPFGYIAAGDKQLAEQIILKKQSGDPNNKLWNHLLAEVYRHVLVGSQVRCTAASSAVSVCVTRTACMRIRFAANSIQLPMPSCSCLLGCI
jgi:hypothetical protein